MNKTLALHLGVMVLVAAGCQRGSVLAGVTDADAAVAQEAGDADAASEPDGSAQPEAFALSDFQFGACNAAAAEPAPPLFTGRNSPDYAGLQCVAWQRSEPGRLRLDFINAEASCGFPRGQGGLWRPTLELRGDGTLDVKVEWDFASANACGACLQDFSFVVTGTGVDEVRSTGLLTRSCTSDCPWGTAVETVALTADGGVTCRYPNLLHVSGLEEGALHMPPKQGVCQAGLTPVLNDLGSTICAVSCGADQDCPLEGLLSCTDGACVLSAAP